MPINRVLVPQQEIQHHDCPQRGRHQQLIAVGFPEVLAAVDQRQDGDRPQQQGEWDYRPQRRRNQFGMTRPIVIGRPIVMGRIIVIGRPVVIRRIIGRGHLRHSVRRRLPGGIRHEQGG
jgi:hypothetical protein